MNQVPPSRLPIDEHCHSQSPPHRQTRSLPAASPSTKTVKPSHLPLCRTHQPLLSAASLFVKSLLLSVPTVVVVYATILAIGFTIVPCLYFARLVSPLIFFLWSSLLQPLPICKSIDFIFIVLSASKHCCILLLLIFFSDGVVARIGLQLLVADWWGLVDWTTGRLLVEAYL